jgi:hypothetical protein
MAQPGRLELSEQPYKTRLEQSRVAGGLQVFAPDGKESEERRSASECSRGAERLSLSLGERAGVRANVPQTSLFPTTPGHVMKVSDSSQAYGAILGKAMSSLPEGKGLVLVLVSLQ